MANESDRDAHEGLRLTRCRQATEFNARVGGFLASREAENILPLGIISQLLAHPDVGQGRLDPYFGLVEAGGAVVAAAIMTRPTHLVLSHVEQPEALALLARDVYDFEPLTASVIGVTPHSQQFADHWQAVTGRRPRLGMSESIYQLSRVRPPAGAPGHARRITRADLRLVSEWLTDFAVEALGEATPDALHMAEQYLTLNTRGMYLWDDDGPVSMSGYAGPTPNGIRIGPVYTPPELRGRGYASALVARLSQDLLDGGRKYCFLFADAANPTSNHIYQAIGYEAVCEAQVVKMPTGP